MMHCRLAVVPGLLAVLTVTLISWSIARLQLAFGGYVWIDELVLAILLGTAAHTAFGLHQTLRTGVHFASKYLLEIAIVLLGASVSVTTIADAGGSLIVTVAVIVVLSLCISYGIGRLLGLSDSLATLVACGNSICGNSAIVAAAPVIDARPEDVASSIAFTAGLGVLLVLTLPLAFVAFGISEWQYGILAGLTVYAVPQVLAATAPVGAVSLQVGTIVKLMRVLMLGPVVLALGLRSGSRGGRVSARHLLPWFIVGFFIMMAMNSWGMIPAEATHTIKQAATALTSMSMAGLGLSVNIRSVYASGGRVLLTGVLSITILALLAGVAIAFLPQI